MKTMWGLGEEVECKTYRMKSVFYLYLGEQ